MRSFEENVIDRANILEELNLLTHVLLTRGRVSASRLAVDRLAFVLAEPSGQRLEGGANIVGDALCVSARVIRVEVFCRRKT